MSRSRYKSRSTVQVNDTLEELGKRQNACCEVTIDVHIESPERQTWDYPGSPGGIEVEEVTVTEYCNGEVTVKRSDRPDWFKWLDRVVAKRVDQERVIDRLESYADY